MRKLLGILVIILALSEVNVVKAQQLDLENDIDLATLNCRTLLTMDGEEMDLTLLFFHGFMSGKNNQMIVNGTALAEVTDKVVNDCIDNPEEPLLNVFTKYRSGS